VVAEMEEKPCPSPIKTEKIRVLARSSPSPTRGWQYPRSRAAGGSAAEMVVESPPPARARRIKPDQPTTTAIPIVCSDKRPMSPVSPVGTSDHNLFFSELENQEISGEFTSNPGEISEKLSHNPESVQDFYLEESVSQEEESDGVEVSEEDPEGVPGTLRKRKSFYEEGDISGATSDKSENNPQPKKRQRTSPEQLEILEQVYLQERLPGLDLRKELAQKLKMTPRRVQVWFQNKRAKEKRMVTANNEFSEYARSISIKNA